MLDSLIKNRIAKKRLKNAFSIAELYYERKWNGKPVRQFPQILDIKFRPDKTIYKFKLPHGVDPKELKKKEYVFRSMFGELIEFKGTSNIVLTVYHSAHYGTYEYNFSDWEPIMKTMKLPIIAGKDINGKLHAYDMVNNPHLLVAGETGSGKSVMLRSILTSLIQHKRTGLQLFLADLKRSEFHLFRNIDNVEVMTDKKDLKKCIYWLHKQLEIRGDMLDSYELSHIDELEKPLDYYVLCIDEFSILRDQKDTLEKLLDITALGRALGIFVILSTQRPDRKIVDGLLKANLTVRYAFRHADKLNSRITLGDGAKVDASQIDEEDKGKFFMRFSGFKYLQSPYLSVEKAKEILEGYKSPLQRKTKFDASDDVIDYEGEVTESIEFDLLGEDIDE